MYKLTILLFSIVLISPIVFGQTIINSSGKNISNNKNMLTYSIGEIVVSTINNNQNILTQGFLQSNYQNVTSIKNQINELNLNYYPNPAFNEINIRSSKTIEKIQIYDIGGKMVSDLEFKNNPIDISHLNNGIYIVKIFDAKEKFVKLFKLIKH